MGTRRRIIAATVVLSAMSCAKLRDKNSFGPDADLRRVIDLSDPSEIAVGTCGNYFFDEFPGRRGTVIPAGLADFPVVIKLPIVSVPDLACEQTCEAIEDSEWGQTLFGIAIELEDNASEFRNSDKTIKIVAPSPWYVVSGGCGEACPYPCLHGYQEFGFPKSEFIWQHGDFGFATDQFTNEVLEVTLDLIPR